MATNYPSSIDSYTTKVDGVSDVLAADTNNLQDAVVALQTRVGTTANPTFVTVGTTQTVTGAKTFSDKVTGRASGNTDGLHAFFAPTTGGAFSNMWSRRGPYTSTINHSGSSYAPSLSVVYEYTGSYAGVYSIGHLATSGANPGALTVHHINSAGGASTNWRFDGATGQFVTAALAFSDGTTMSSAGGGSVGFSGWTKLPSGLIVQWGSYIAPADDSRVVALPIAFPTGGAFVMHTHGGGGPNGFVPRAYFADNANIVLGADTFYSSSPDVSHYFLALGF